VSRLPITSSNHQSPVFHCCHDHNKLKLSRPQQIEIIISKDSDENEIDMILTKGIVLLGFLFFTSSAFSPSRPSQLTRWRNPTCRSDLNQITLQTATDGVLTEHRLQGIDGPKLPENISRHRLELDSTGCLRLGDGADVLVKGLNPSVWSATRPPSGDNRALFLHTSHPKEQAGHQIALSDLISCSRLLACSRTYIKN
jgi:hypothetical protein